MSELTASQRFHNLCAALEEQAKESPFTREEWELVDKETAKLKSELAKAINLLIRANETGRLFGSDVLKDIIEFVHHPGCWKLHSPSGQGECNCGAEGPSKP